jgi:hypothetical protein
MTNGQVLIGSTGADPVPAELTAGSNITITPGAGSISIASTASGGTKLVNQAFASTTNAVTTNSAFNVTSTPTITQGASVLTLNYTPKSATNILYVVGNSFGSSGSAAQVGLALFQQGVTNALHCVHMATNVSAGASGTGCATVMWIGSAATTSLRTYEIRVGRSSGTVSTVTAMATTSGSKFFGTAGVTWLYIYEIEP